MKKYEYHNITGNKQYYVEVNSRKFITHLVNLKVRQAKSSNEHVYSEKIPKEFIRDYIRGLWDGDGHIDKKRIDLVNSVEILLFVQEYLNKICEIPINKIFDHCNTYRIFICKNRGRVLRHLYYDNCTALNRKYKYVKEYYQ